MGTKVKKFFVIGNPIEHSMSPKLQNKWLKENNIPAIYEKIKLEENEIKSFIRDIKNQKVTGCNVTVPYKKKVIPFLNKLTIEAQKTQSVNTIAFDDGNLIGHNTDIIGFENAVKNLNFNMKSKKILILGAGGVVPSIVYALKNMQVKEIIISNRTKEKAENLKNLFNFLKVVEWGNLPDFDVIINATSLGLNNEIIKLDFSSEIKNKLFYDVIYNPPESNFLKKGKELGNMTENGQAMFVYQALEAFKIWHKKEPKINSDIYKFLSND